MEKKDNDFTGQIECISLLRIVGAFGMALYHIGTFNSAIKTLQAGVSIFFCISAFLMMYTTQQKPKNTFLINRLIRIVPLYWLITIGTFSATKILNLSDFGGGTWVELIKSLLFIPYVRGSMKSGYVVRPIVGPAWTLFYDVVFVCIFALCMKVNHKLRGGVALVCIGLALFQGKFSVNDPVLYVIGSAWWLSFAVGILAFYILRTAWNKCFTRVELIILAMVDIAAIFLMYMLRLNMYRNALLALAAFLSTLLLFKNCKMPKIVNFLGKISYSFYLIHYYVIIILGRIFDWKSCEPKTMIGIVLVYVISIIAAFISYEIVEVRVCGFIKKQYNGKL